MPRMRLNGEAIHYEIEGKGPPLVLIHSLGTSNYLWRDAIAHWKSRYTVVAMDARGHGKSSNHGGVTIENIAGDLRALVDGLQLGTADLIGISMGGLIATRFYTLAPEKVRRIVLADTFGKMPEGESRVAAMTQKLQATSMADYGKEYASQTLLPATAADKHRELAGSVAATAQQAYLQTVASLFTQDIRPLLSNIKIPALVVIGDQDLRTPIALSNEIMSLVPGARMAVIPDSGHLPNIDNPPAFQAAIDDFLLSDERASR
jgi:3-oxoadipate enol-lactonase